MLSNFKYLLAGSYFGFILVKSEVVSWFRIQEMFRFQDFHMYGVIGSAIIIGILSIQIVKRLNVKDLDGNPITISPKDSSQWKRYLIGGSFFGLGWAILGACPGPIFALLGTGLTIMAIPVATAILGTWIYGAVRHTLPH